MKIFQFFLRFFKFICREYDCNFAPSYLIVQLDLLKTTDLLKYKIHSIPFGIILVHKKHEVKTVRLFVKKAVDWNEVKRGKDGFRSRGGFRGGRGGGRGDDDYYDRRGSSRDDYGGGRRGGRGGRGGGFSRRDDRDDMYDSGYR